MLGSSGSERCRANSTIQGSVFRSFIKGGDRISKYVVERKNKEKKEKKEAKKKRVEGKRREQSRKKGGRKEAGAAKEGGEEGRAKSKPRQAGDSEQGCWFAGVSRKTLRGGACGAEFGLE